MTTVHPPIWVVNYTAGEYFFARTMTEGIRKAQDLSSPPDDLEEGEVPDGETRWRMAGISANTPDYIVMKQMKDNPVLAEVILEHDPTLFVVPRACQGFNLVSFKSGDP
jgi:hypothetical protein